MASKPKRYYVNWNDPHYPRIYLATEDTPEYYALGTYHQAKAEIIAKCRANIADAREYIAEVRSWRVGEITTEDGG